MLLKNVRTSSGTVVLQPRMVYCYRSIITEFLERPDFFHKCEQWRSRSTSTGTFGDVYDGCIWKKFQSVNGRSFLSSPFNFAFIMNVDWYQPFKRTSYSLGVIYLAFLNLPRNERYLRQNILVVGIIPGPHEPSLMINTFLRPMVDELKLLWNGVVVKPQSKNQSFVRAALLCIACDIPAGRKVCGFVGHRALYGCTKCLKQFPTESFGSMNDYSGFDRDSWPVRNYAEHKRYANAHLAAKTKSEKDAIERAHGCRYSLLLELPYFDPIAMCVIDPMHNLLLGTAKHMIHVWKTNNILSVKEFEIIQNRVDSFTTPTDIGRIPSKISSGYNGFTAEQWQNWTTLFSLYSLKDILPFRDYNCWHSFVKAAYLLCSRKVSLHEIEEADKHLMEFLHSFQTLYGKPMCTINLHLHAHIKDCLLNFGPVHNFWCFAFERMNGILGNYRTNCRDISVQIMRRSIDAYSFAVHNWPTDLKNDLSFLIENSLYNQGSLKEASLQQILHHSSPFQLLEMIHGLPPIRECAFESHKRECTCIHQQVVVHCISSPYIACKV